MKTLLSILGSMKTMVILMLIFAFSVGYATIVENDFGTMTAKAEIYNARWFEILLGFLALNLILNISKYKMYTLKKAPIFIFHVAFLVILIGAAITRYFGFEGTMHIREGMTASSILSADTYFTVNASYQDENATVSKITYLSKRSKNDLEAEFKLKDKKVDVKLVEYIPDAIETIVEDSKGSAIANLMITGGGQGKPVALKEGHYYDAETFVLDFNSGEHFDKPVISIFMLDGKPYMKHDMKLSYFRMADRAKGDLSANEQEVFNTRVLYSTDLGSFVLRKFIPHASKKIISDPKAKAKAAGLNVLRFKVDVNGKTEKVLVYGRKGMEGKPEHVTIDGVDVYVSFGSKEIPIPFKIKLLDFQLDRYPGSMSPASYASEVELIDEEEGIHMPYRIYMNHILEHRHYRFFQASYDRDEKGTVLSVNHDPGTLPTYVGYFLLALGLWWAVFKKGGRFSKLAAKAKKASEAKLAPALLAFGLMLSLTPAHADEIDPAVKTILSFDKEHTQKFGELIVQDTKGRMKPVDTLATEILAKIHRSADLKIGKESLDANQVILGMMIRPDIYKNVKLIRTGDEKINKRIGVQTDAKYVSFGQFFQDPEGMRGYKLAELVDAASRKAPKDRNKLDKAALKVDEKVNVVYMVFTGSLMKIWPVPNDANNKWLATIDSLEKLPADKANIVKEAAINYFTAVDDALQNDDWSSSNTALAKIAEYQHKYGAAVYPSEGKIKAEIFYNHSNVFEILWPLYFVMGFVLLILSFIQIVKPKFKMKLITKTSLGLLILFFIAHTIGLALRWYISGHAPWSNGFESMTYIAWATVLAGFIFSKRSPITLAATSILAGLILFVAHLSWMNPQVTNLVPVLNSYWLSIHVSMITASYGFLGLGALLGFITLILYIIANETNKKQISLSIIELNAINEMSLMIGLILLTVGNFLGGVWANESWGRYWGWDPKETWALVTILVYAVVIHLRFIKSIYNEFNYSVISLLAFTSVLMTYFGVNYYLAGMHSYAKGDPVPIPDFVPVTYAIVFVIITLAFRNRKIA
ncbi:cytochrome c biogenesis protein CcsA [Sulfurimonas sp.]|uniref:cytochrome c biogenesis protein CcsA n=1 Tax=Sulfurimonas sp. TaxID=2022749 RepID=UPI0026283F35|nr:cytochrome c biogenesis protein CcsA [Sulfurimonas sp.]